MCSMGEETFGSSRPSWRKATPSQRFGLVVEEVQWQSRQWGVQKLSLTKSTSWLAARQSSLKAGRPGSTTRCSSAYLVFLRPGGYPSMPMASTAKSGSGQLGGAWDWRLLAVLDQRLCFLPEITITIFRPDLVLWSPSLGKVYIIELTVPRDDAVEETYERLSTLSWLLTLNIVVGKPRFAQLRSAAEASSTSLLKDIGICG